MADRNPCSAFWRNSLVLFREFQNSEHGDPEHGLCSGQNTDDPCSGKGPFRVPNSCLTPVLIDPDFRILDRQERSGLGAHEVGREHPNEGRAHLAGLVPLDGRAE